MGRWVFLPRKRAIHIRPEFSQDVSRHIDADLNREPTRRIAGGPIVRVVGVADGNGGRVTGEFGVVEFPSAVVAVREDDLPHGVSQPGPRASRAFAKVSRVLVQQRRIDRVRHHISDCQVSVRRPVITPVTGHPVPI